MKIAMERSGAAAFYMVNGRSQSGGCLAFAQVCCIVECGRVGGRDHGNDVRGSSCMHSALCCVGGARATTAVHCCARATTTTHHCAKPPTGTWNLLQPHTGILHHSGRHPPSASSFHHDVTSPLQAFWQGQRRNSGPCMFPTIRMEVILFLCQ